MSVRKIKLALLASVSLVSFQAAPAVSENALGAAIVGAIIYCGATGACGQQQQGSRPSSSVGDAIQLDRSQKVAIQEGLSVGGFYDGALDGLIGGGTRASIRSYQESIGAKATGYLTHEQVTDLMRLSAEYRVLDDSDDRLFEIEFGDTLENDDVRRVQIALNDMGYNAGTPDGQIGRNTRSAIAKFKDAMGLAGPAVATERLLAKLSGEEYRESGNNDIASVSDEADSTSVLGRYRTMEYSELNCVDSPLIVTRQSVVFYESVCQFPEAITGSETEVSGIMICEGEGEKWASHRALSYSNDILEITFDRQSKFQYVRCGSDADVEMAEVTTEVEPNAAPVSVPKSTGSGSKGAPVSDTPPPVKK